MRPDNAVKGISMVSLQLLDLRRFLDSLERFLLASDSIFFKSNCPNDGWIVRDLPGTHSHITSVLGRPGLRDSSTLRCRNGGRHLSSCDVSSVAWAGTLALRVCAALPSAH